MSTTAQAFYNALRTIDDARTSWVHTPEQLRDDRIKKWLTTVEPGTNENTQHTPWSPPTFTYIAPSRLRVKHSKPKV